MPPKVMLKINKKDIDPGKPNDNTQSSPKILLKINNSKDLGPVSYLNSYYNSPLFKKRFDEFHGAIPKDRANKLYDKVTERINQGSSTYKPFVIDNGSSVAQLGGFDKNDPSIPKNMPANTNMILSKSDERLGANLFNSILPHEYSHLTRGLTPEEEKYLLSKNSKYALPQSLNKFMSKAYKEAQKQGSYNLNNTSNYLGAYYPILHNANPSENYGDINSLRYMLYKRGIYDSRERDMTPVDLEKAKLDPWLKSQMIFQRIMRNHNEEDLLKIMNKIATNSTNNSSNT